jgi:heat shock protein HtpX
MDRTYRRYWYTTLAQTATIAGIILYLVMRATAILLGSAGAVVSLGVLSAYAFHRFQTAAVTLPGRAERVSPAAAPWLHRVVRDLSERARLQEPPALYLLPGDVPLAFTTGSTAHAAIVLSHGLLRVLPRRQVYAVLAHEIAHLRHHDMELFGFVAVLQGLARITAAIAGGVAFLFLPVLSLHAVPGMLSAFLYLSAIPLVTGLLGFALARTREYGADLGALRLGAAPEDLAGALRTLESYLRFFQGHRHGDDLEYLRTHPPTSRRIERLRRFQYMTFPGFSRYNHSHALSMGRNSQRDRRQRGDHPYAVW